MGIGLQRFLNSIGEDLTAKFPGVLEMIRREVRHTKNKFMRLDFDSHPAFKGKVLADGSTLAHGAPTGATGDENIMIYPNGSLEYHILGTQTLLTPLVAATGLDIAMDQSDGDGIEICAGILASNKLAYTIGTHAFYAKMRFSIADASGTDDCAFGFRLVEAYQANLDDYNDLACLNVIEDASAAVPIYIETILNGGGTTTTDTTNTWADTSTHELAVYVSDAGVVTYTIDGVPPTVTAAFTFDDADVVVPFMYFLQDSDLTGAIVLLNFECGLQ